MYDLVLSEKIDRKKVLALGFTGVCGPKKDFDLELKIVKGKPKRLLGKKFLLFFGCGGVRYVVEHGLVDGIISSEVGAGPKFPLDFRNSGLSHVDVKFAARNNVAIVFNFNDFFKARAFFRPILFSRMLQNAALAKKYGAPVVVCSGAKSDEELVSKSDLVGFAELLGLEKKGLNKAFLEVKQR